MDNNGRTIRERITVEYFRVKDLIGKVPSRLELFTYMDDDIYQLAIAHSKDNPFKKYMEFLHGIGDLPAEDEELYQGIGREFISLIENTNMTKVYKMPVLMAFYNHGSVRMEVSEEELLTAWKEFFDAGANWKDLEEGITYDRYQAISDKDHIKKILQMPVHFLQESGKGFFITRPGSALALRDEMRDVVGLDAFARQMGDVIEYRTMDYYRRRWRGEEN